MMSSCTRAASDTDHLYFTAGRTPLTAEPRGTFGPGTCMDPPVEDDIEFDFFEDEPATQEAQRARLPRRAQRGPRRPVGPPRGLTPLVRLFVLVLFVIFLVLVLALLLQSCASQSKHDAYAHYMDKVDKIASESSSNGRALADALTTPGVKVA